jgi:SAM-dependent methyltransferase
MYMKCPICSNELFSQVVVLQQRLIDEWGLTPYEVDYINKQQGFHCTKCSSNLRMMTLASIIMKNYSYYGLFKDFCYSQLGNELLLLEINEVGSLHSILKKFKNYIFAEFPSVDMQNLPYKENSFDLIIHSDSLEHVENSKLAMQECYRVLKNNGSMFYTIPIVHGRMTRKRDILSKSYHGSQNESQGEDYKVWTEYGADFWVEIINSGFNEITLHTLGDLSSIGICAKKFQKK